MTLDMGYDITAKGGCFLGHSLGEIKQNDYLD